MKLLLIAALLLSYSISAQELNHEIKKLIQSIELNPPTLNSKTLPSASLGARIIIRSAGEIILEKQVDTTPSADSLKKLWEHQFYLEQFKKNRNWQKSLITVPANSLTLVGKEPGVYRLPQDNMPCIVPHTKDIARIPNKWKGKVGLFMGSIPNPAEPKTLPEATK